MTYDISAPRADYISNSLMSYRKIAKKYDIPLSFIKKKAKEEEWFKQKKYLCEGCSSDKPLQEGGDDKLKTLKKSSDRAIEALYFKMFDFEELSINDLKNISSILKTLTAVQRDLNDLPTFKEENSLRISNEKLKLVRAKISSGDDENETGVVLIPLISDEEEDDENIIIEGEENV